MNFLKVEDFTALRFFGSWQIVYQPLAASRAATKATIMAREAVEAPAEAEAVSGRASTLLLLTELEDRGSILMNLFLLLFQGL